MGCAKWRSDSKRNRLKILAGYARTDTVLSTATFGEIGRRIVEFEQGGKARAAYGAQLIN
ncbi:hypothetical protein DNX30_11515 [Escherichia coli]|uniref:Uncharacterized protein n=1 Tax=Escherichia coli TaxID=562 RepID=A0A3R0MXG3_ECOLX|nr:hypothetical protein [Escherichia coli]EEY5967146.1 hypothetical protein [Escherichia coli]EFC2150495.1 hypothetical protein [Escherichia coli]EFE7138355.1 hypothetical protein [Escherichia coli]EFH6850649.1 hypothetical protein [Escherichia coli]